MTKEEKQIETKKYAVSEIQQVAGYVVKDVSTGEEFDIITALAKIMNDLEIIKKSVA